MLFRKPIPGQRDSGNINITVLPEDCAKEEEEEKEEKEKPEQVEVKNRIFFGYLLKTFATPSLLLLYN